MYFVTQAIDLSSQSVCMAVLHCCVCAAFMTSENSLTTVCILALIIHFVTRLEQKQSKMTNFLMKHNTSDVLKLPPAGLSLHKMTDQLWCAVAIATQMLSKLIK